jgi:hypothetical protein
MKLVVFDFKMYSQAGEHLNKVNSLLRIILDNEDASDTIF